MATKKRKRISRKDITSSRGPAIDIENRPVIDPTENVLALVATARTWRLK